MEKIVTVVGARPQFVKAACFSKALRESGAAQEVIVHTGQHYDPGMSQVFFDQLGIADPHYNLSINGGSHGQMTGRILESIEKVLLQESPQLIVVFGDTNSTLAGALAAAKLCIPIAHVEAGLRSFNRSMPEETNRILTDHMSDILFTPTEQASKNLAAEGILENVFLVGDIMFDAMKMYSAHSRKPAWFDKLKLQAGGFVLATIHRAENNDSDRRLRDIFRGLSKCGLDVVIPLHPRTKNAVEQMGVKIGDNVHLLEPVGYLEMLWLQKHCKLVATDSGGVQKEAYFNGKPCVTLRDETEWVELVFDGWNTLVGSNPERIVSAIKSATVPSSIANLYGDGNTSLAIVQECLQFICSKK